MNTYILWTRTARFEAESQQVPYRWKGSYGEGERQLATLNPPRRVASFYVSVGREPKNTQDLNAIAR